MKLSDYAPVDIELIETVKDGGPVVVPNMIRINGKPVLAPSGSQVIIETNMETSIVTATITVMINSLTVARTTPEVDQPIES